MAIFQSDVAKGLVSYPVPYAANEVCCLEFDFTFSTTFVAAADKLELGVIPQGASVRMPVTEVLRAKIASGAVFAISVEPAGGSTTGAPTGPVVAAGDLKAI